MFQKSNKMSNAFKVIYSRQKTLKTQKAHSLSSCSEFIAWVISWWIAQVLKLIDVNILRLYFGWGFETETHNVFIQEVRVSLKMVLFRFLSFSYFRSDLTFSQLFQNQIYEPIPLHSNVIHSKQQTALRSACTEWFYPRFQMSRLRSGVFA